MTFKCVHKEHFFDFDTTGRNITLVGGSFFETYGREIVERWVLGYIDSIKQQSAPARVRISPNRIAVFLAS